MHDYIKSIIENHNISSIRKQEELKDLINSIEIAERILSGELTYCIYCGDYYLSKSFFTEDEYKEENVCTFVDPINSGGNIYEKKEVKYTYKYCPKGHKHLILKTE